MLSFLKKGYYKAKHREKGAVESLTFMGTPMGRIASPEMTSSFASKFETDYKQAKRLYELEKESDYR
jgi:hypothetical protein